jgi:hypothetical protein
MRTLTSRLLNRGSSTAANSNRKPANPCAWNSPMTSPCAPEPSWLPPVLVTGEEQFLAEVAERFGFTDTQFSYIKARHVSSAKRNPYEVLGVTPDIGNDALKIHYRKLVVDNHPDKMIARGVPPEFVTIATKKIAAINAAYVAVARERRI